MFKVRKRKLKVIFAISVSIALLALHIVINVNPIIKEVSQKEVQALAEIAVNNACEEVLEKYPISDAINYKTDDVGNLVLITTNTAIMNVIARKATDLSYKKISSFGESGVPIPLGSMSGITLLSGCGPSVYVKVCPVGSINSNFKSEFVAAGINQTCHKITLHVNSDVKVIMPGMNNIVKTETQIVICENIIVGKVPETYLNIDNLSELLNLVP